MTKTSGYENRHSALQTITRCLVISGAILSLCGTPTWAALGTSEEGPTSVGGVVCNYEYQASFLAYYWDGKRLPASNMDDLLKQINPDNEYENCGFGRFLIDQQELVMSGTCEGGTYQIWRIQITKLSNSRTGTWVYLERPIEQFFLELSPK